MGGYIKRSLNWLLSFFQSETPELDEKINQKKKEVEAIDKELENEYDSVKDSMEEWK